MPDSEYTLEELEKCARKAIIDNCDYLYKLLISNDICKEQFSIAFVSLVLCYMEPGKTFTPEILTDAINHARLNIIEEERIKDLAGEEWKDDSISFTEIEDFWNALDK